MLHTNGGGGGRDVNVHCIASSEDVVTLKIGVAYKWGEWRDVNVHCIASSEEVVTLKIGVAYRWGGGGMLTFIALRHQRMLLRSRSCYVEDVVTFKLLLR